MYMGRSRPARRLSPANPARGLRVRTRRSINGRTPETGTNHLGGSFDSFDAKADGRPSYRPRRSTKNPSHGEGVLCANSGLYSTLGPMQGPVRFLHRDFFRRSHDATLRPAHARGEGPPPRRAEGRARRFRPRVPGPDRRRGTGGAAVNSPTTGYPAPAAAPRTGRGKSAPRGTQSKTSIPFAAIPHDIAADPRLSPTDLRVLAALFYFARADASCWPCDNSIAARVHRHPGTVRRSLRHLEDLGYIRRQPSRENPTGRLIHLTCREPDWERPRQAPVPARRRTGGSSAVRGGVERRARRRRRDRRRSENRRICTPGTITTGSGPTARGSPHPARDGPAPGQGCHPGPRSPGN